MKRVIGKFFIAILVSSMISGSLVAQESAATSDNSFEKFQATDNVTVRFNLFFDTPNRYNENSAYDWLDKTNQYLKLAEKSQDSLPITQYKIIQAQIYNDLGEFDKSLAIAKEIYQKIPKLELNTKTVLLDLMDHNFAELGFYTEQIDIRKEKKTLGISKNVSFYDIYSNLGLHRKAMEDYIEQVKKTLDEKDYYAIAVYNNNVGTYLRLAKSTPTALNTFKKAKSYSDLNMIDVMKVKSDKEIFEANQLHAIILGNIGKCQVEMGAFEDAIPNLEKSIEAFNEFNNGAYSSEMVENQLAVTECYLELNDLKKATDYLSNNLHTKKIENLIKKNRLLSVLYNKTGDYKNESFYLRKNIRINDSISNNVSELLRQQVGTVMAEEMKNTKSELAENRQVLEQQKSEMKAQDERLDLVFISLVFTLLLFSGLVYAYMRSIKNQRLIAEQKHIIENALTEKDSLLKEIHHRVKNNLQMVSSLLSLQTKNTRSKAAIEALEEGKSRVKAMALIHQKLYQNDDLSVIEMQGYIESLINSVQSVYKKGGHNINITIDAEGVELDIDRAIPFGLILNELVSNSFKYAFPVDDENGKIYIHLRKIGNKEGFFEYTDNGVGLPEDTDERANSSMGIRLMNRLANQLQTKLNVDNTTEGVRFWFNFA
ncbi:MAG: sensor histidine kinase [Flavobacteriaceae bacterium]